MARTRKFRQSRITLSLTFSAWACFSADYGGVKLHLLYDPGAAVPTYFAITPNRINDITPAKAMPLEPGTTYVMDRGYYDFGFWAKLDEAGCRFVTRLKSQRRNPYPQPLREIVVQREAGGQLRLVTNDLDRPAEAIVDLYKTRWQIELFFKWIKQNLKIKSFLGTSLNAVTPQIITALIAYLLLH